MVANGLLTEFCPVKPANGLLGVGAGAGVFSFSASSVFDVTGAPNIGLNGWLSAGLAAALSVAGLGVANILPNAGEVLVSLPDSVGLETAGVPNKVLNGCDSAGAFEAGSSAEGFGVANMFPNAGVALGLSSAPAVFEGAGVPNIDLNGCGSPEAFEAASSAGGFGVANIPPNAGVALDLSSPPAVFEAAGVPNIAPKGLASATFPVPSVPVTLGMDKLAKGLLGVEASAAGLGAKRLLVDSAGLGVVLAPKILPSGFGPSVGFAGVSSAGVLGANRLLGAVVDKLANGLLAAGCALASSGFDAAGAPKRGWKGLFSSGFAVSSVAVGFGAKGLFVVCPERLENGLASGDPPTAGLDAKIEPLLGLGSGEVCILSSAGEVMCALDCPNRPELVGVFVLCCVPNPPKDGAGVGVDWFPVPPALNPPKLNPLVPVWELPPNDVFTPKELLAG